MTETAPKLYDKMGREIMCGDVLKVFHFTGTRRKRYYMYKHVVGRKELPKGTPVFEIDHMEASSEHQTYYETIDGRTLGTYEIVQGFGENGLQHFDTRPRIKVSTP
jgi:hypothetical protein